MPNIDLWNHLVEGIVPTRKLNFGNSQGPVGIHYNDSYQKLHGVAQALIAQYLPELDLDPVMMKFPRRTESLKMSDTPPKERTEASSSNFRCDHCYLLFPTLSLCQEYAPTSYSWWILRRYALLNPEVFCHSAFSIPKQPLSLQLTSQEEALGQPIPETPHLSTAHSTPRVNIREISFDSEPPFRLSVFSTAPPSVTGTEPGNSPPIWTEINDLLTPAEQGEFIEPSKNSASCLTNMSSGADDSYPQSKEFSVMENSVELPYCCRLSNVATHSTSHLASQCTTSTEEPLIEHAWSFLSHYNPPIELCLPSITPKKARDFLSRKLLTSMEPLHAPTLIPPEYISHACYQTLVQPHSTSELGQNPPRFPRLAPRLILPLLYDPWAAAVWELAATEQITLDCSKGFQSWNHRKEVLLNAALSMTKAIHYELIHRNNDSQELAQLLRNELSTTTKTFPHLSFADLDERILTEKSFELVDPKNYHAWSHRAWFLGFVGLLDCVNALDKELCFTAKLIEEDVFNDTAWVHRFLVIQHRIRNYIDCSTKPHCNFFTRNDFLTSSEATVATATEASVHLSHSVCSCSQIGTSCRFLASLKRSKGSLIDAEPMVILFPTGLFPRQAVINTRFPLSKLSHRRQRLRLSSSSILFTDVPTTIEELLRVSHLQLDKFEQELQFVTEWVQFEPRNESPFKYMGNLVEFILDLLAKEQMVSPKSSIRSLIEHVLNSLAQSIENFLTLLEQSSESGSYVLLRQQPGRGETFASTSLLGMGLEDTPLWWARDDGSVGSLVERNEENSPCIKAAAECVLLRETDVWLEWCKLAYRLKSCWLTLNIFTQKERLDLLHRLQCIDPAHRMLWQAECL